MERDAETRRRWERRADDSPTKTSRDALRWDHAGDGSSSRAALRWDHSGDTGDRAHQRAGGTRDERQRRWDHRLRDSSRHAERQASRDEKRSASSVSLSSSSMAIKLWKCYQSRVSGGRQEDDVVFDDIFEMIDSDLQPVKPDPNCADSVRVFENHKKLAKDYLKLQTEVTLLSTRKKQLEERLTRLAAARRPPDTAQYASELVQLQHDNESLRELHKMLLKERAELTRQPSPLDAGWSLT